MNGCIAFLLLAVSTVLWMVIGWLLIEFGKALMF